MRRKCIYCGNEKPINEFSLEHIFPDSLGGALCNMLFKTNSVCQRCNSICGIWVDAPIIKNWFSKNYDFLSAREFVDLQNGSILPLIYMGISTKLSDKDNVCELWLGPCGDPIYHFRKKADPRYDSIVGGDFIDYRKNPGTAYLFIATDNNYWIKTVLLSFKNHFKNSRRIACNLLVKGELSDINLFDLPNENDNKIIEILKTYRGQYHETQFSTEIGFEQRFLCKIALGIGFNLFGEEYLKSSYALELKKGLWEKDFDSRNQLKIYYTSFKYEENDFTRLLCYKGAHLISLLSIGDYLSLGFCLYGKIFSQIAISDEKRFWKNENEFSDGIVYLIFPQIKKFLGPYDLPIYLAHKTEKDFSIEELVVIERKRIKLEKLPPFRSKDYNKKIL